MNIFTIASFLIAIGVLVTGFYMSSSNIGVFLDFPSLFIVAGGTFSATAIAFQLDRIISLIKIPIVNLIKGKKLNFSDIISNLIQLSDMYVKGASLDDLIAKSNDPFLKEAFELFKDGVKSEAGTIEMLKKRADNILFHYNEDANKIKSVGKFPPAFGMMGTTIGMVVLLGNLGGEDAMKTLGPAMAVCLITTLYGVIMANLFFVPIADNLKDSAKEIHLKNKIVLEAVSLIMKKTNPILLAEELNSFLPPSKRLDWKTAMKAS